VFVSHTAASQRPGDTPVPRSGTYGNSPPFPGSPASPTLACWGIVDKTAMHFAIDPGFTVEPGYSDWKTGNRRRIKNWPLIRSASLNS